MKITSFHCKDRTKKFFPVTDRVLRDTMQKISHGQQYEYPNAKPSIQLKPKKFRCYKCTLICHNNSAVQIQTIHNNSKLWAIIHIHTKLP